MKYLALVYYQENIMNAMSQQEWDSLNQECIACSEKLQNSGHMLDGSALQSVETATTLRVRNGGFYLLEARDINEAIQLAGNIPPARYGSIEIRPVRELQTEQNIRGG